MNQLETRMNAVNCEDVRILTVCLIFNYCRGGYISLYSVIVCQYVCEHYHCNVNNGDVQGIGTVISLMTHTYSVQYSEKYNQSNIQHKRKVLWNLKASHCH